LPPSSHLFPYTTLFRSEVRGACLVVYPGFDEPELLLGMSRSSASIERLAVTTLSIQYPVEEGVRALRNRIEDCRRGGGRVVLVEDRKSTRLNSSHVSIS